MVNEVTTVRIDPPDLDRLTATRPNSYSARDYINSIPEFTGSNYPAAEFILACEDAKEFIPTDTEKVLLRQLKYRLRNPALNRVMIAHITTIDDLKAFIKRYYQPTKSPDEWLDEFSHFFQKTNEQVSDFSFRIGQHLSSTLNAIKTLPAADQEMHTKQAKTKAVKYFVLGLTADLRAAMRNANFTEISEASENAIEFERIFSREQKIDRSRSTDPDNSKSCLVAQASTTQNQNKFEKYCSNCKMNNHNDSECFKKKKQFNQSQGASNSNQNSYNFRPNAFSNQNAQNFNRGTFNSNAPNTYRNTFDSNGYNSNRNGYNQTAPNSNGSFNRNFNFNNRPNGSITCNYCKKSGHVINDCRKRAYNMNKRATEGFENNHVNSNEDSPRSGNGQVPPQNGALAGNSNPNQARQPFIQNRQ